MAFGRERGDGFGMGLDWPANDESFDPARIEVWRYALRPLDRLNARHQAESVIGALLRHGGGIGCLQPWPALGDAPLDHHLAELRAGRPTTLVKRTLECAAVDGLARRDGRSLFDGLTIPPSHATLPPGSDAPTIQAIIASGFTTVKLKAGPDWKKFLPIWSNVCCHHPSVKIRLDFNGTLSPAEAGAALAGIARALGPAVDFVEDPCPFDRETWLGLEKSSGLRLAADRACADPEAESFLGVLKPAVEDAETAVARAAATGRELVVTTNMDHPVGVLWAAYQAARAARAGVLHGPCGLLTHPLFEADKFSTKLSARDGVLGVPTGTGLGYDEWWAELPWHPLV